MKKLICSANGLRLRFVERGIQQSCQGSELLLLAPTRGAADDFAQLGVFDLAGIGGLRESDQRALAQGRALMRAAVQQAEELALDIEDRDRPLVDGQEFSRPRRQLIHRGNDVSSHQDIPYSFFALPR